MKYYQIVRKDKHMTNLVMQEWMVKVDLEVKDLAAKALVDLKIYLVEASEAEEDLEEEVQNVELTWDKVYKLLLKKLHLVRKHLLRLIEVKNVVSVMEVVLNP